MHCREWRRIQWVLGKRYDGRVRIGRGLNARAVSASSNLALRSRMSSALICVTWGVSVGLVQLAGDKPARLLTALTADLSSVMCAAFMDVVFNGSSAQVLMVGSVRKLTAAPRTLLL